DEAMEHRQSVGCLEVDADAALPAVGAIGDVRSVPPGIPPRVDLDDRGAEIGEHLGAERPGDGEAEVEDDNPLKGGAVPSRRATGDSWRCRRRAGGGRLGAELISVLTD